MSWPLPRKLAYNNNNKQKQIHITVSKMINKNNLNEKMIQITCPRFKFCNQLFAYAAWFWIVTYAPPPPKKKHIVAHMLPKIKKESIRKLSNQWTKTLYQNNLKFITLFFTILLSVITPKTISYESPRKLNFKFHRNCVNTGKILCVRFHFTKFEFKFIFSGSP